MANGVEPQSTRQRALSHVLLWILGLSYLGILAGMWSGLLLVAVLSAVAGSLADIVLGATVRSSLRRLTKLKLFSSARLLIRDGLVLIAATIYFVNISFVTLLILISAIVCIHAGRAFYLHTDYLMRTRSNFRLEWKNIDVDGRDHGYGPYRQPIPGVLGGDGSRLLFATELFMLGGVLVAAWSTAQVWIGVGSAITIFLCLSICAYVTMKLVRFPTQTEIVSANQRLLDVVRQIAPEVVFYFSSPATLGYALSVWSDTAEAIRQPTLIILRENVHLSRVREGTVPTVVLPDARDVDDFHVRSMRVAFYPTNVIKNNHMIRLSGILHCFIGHGDSDKAGSFSPVSRAYDEIWVAGQAGVDRYLATVEGFRDEQIRVVGRPQLSQLRMASHVSSEKASLTVLYAPTWEGFFDESDYSSVEGMGVQLVTALIADGVKVLFKPHPATGQRKIEALHAKRKIEKILSDGPAHSIVPDSPNGLYDAFNSADVLVSDVSSVVSDFLATGKPYIVTNTRNMPVDRFHAQFPTSAGGYPLHAGSPHISEQLDRIVNGDPLRKVRLELREYLLGPSYGEDAFQRFLDEIDLFVERSERRHSAVGAGTHVIDETLA